ncbi:ALG6, ALG8 glycosyltransferase, partial [Hanseniaspora valbyensis NRRL Y-1626]
LITLLALLIRFCLGIGPYSGFNTFPMFGDFEAQRHWLELTLNLPMKDWYFYDLQYWGLDYPILTAYHSLLLGYMGDYLFGGKSRGWFDLDRSRGKEDPNLKSFMRFTVCLTDMIVYIPAVIWFSKKYAKLTNDHSTKSNTKERNIIILLQPSLLIIDHGHFQYNGCMLGLVLLAINNILDDKLGSACVFFVASLCFKQMSLYFAPIIFVYLLKRTLLSFKLLEFCSIGLLTSLTFVLLYFPLYFFNSSHELGIQTLVQGFIRVFPFDRGLFEGKVANFWCVSNLIFKYREVFSNEQLRLYALILTLLAIAPACLLTLFKTSVSNAKKSKKLLIYGLCSCSLSFYLFAFQVHEKSILLPMLPLTLLFVEYNSIKTDLPVAQFLVFFQNVALFSLWPLVKQDGLVLQFFVLFLIYSWMTGGFSFITYKGPGKFNKYIKFLLTSVYFAMAMNIAADLYILPPTRLPDIWVILNCVISFTCFVFIWMW